MGTGGIIASVTLKLAARGEWILVLDPSSQTTLDNIPTTKI